MMECECPYCHNKIKVGIAVDKNKFKGFWTQLRLERDMLTKEITN